MRSMVTSGREQEVTFIPMVLHNKLVKVLTECGEKRGKTVQQLITAAIIEKARAMY